MIRPVMFIIPFLFHFSFKNNQEMKLLGCTPKPLPSGSQPTFSICFLQGNRYANEIPLCGHLKNRQYPPGIVNLVPAYAETSTPKRTCCTRLLILLEPTPSPPPPLPGHSRHRQFITYTYKFRGGATTLRCFKYRSVVLEGNENRL